MTYFILCYFMAINLGFVQQAQTSTKGKPASPPKSKSTSIKPSPVDKKSGKVSKAAPALDKVKPAVDKAKSAKIKPAKENTSSKKKSSRKNTVEEVKEVKNKKNNKNNKKNQNKKNIAVSEDALLNDLLHDNAGKKHQTTADKKMSEYLILTAQAFVELKKKYRNYPIERNFDDHINKLLQKYAKEEKVMLTKTRDSIIQIYAINYIQSFNLRKKEELGALVDQMFTTVNLSSGGHTSPVVIQRLNKVTKDDKVAKLRIIGEELAKIIFDTWKIEIVTLLNRYQIKVK